MPRKGSAWHYPAIVPLTQRKPQEPFGRLGLSIVSIQFFLR